MEAPPNLIAAALTHRTQRKQNELPGGVEPPAAHRHSVLKL